MADSLQTMRSALERYQRAHDPAERQDYAADVCLASRSAYLDFYIWIVTKNELDELAARDLEELLQNALSILEASQYKEAIHRRCKEFRGKCRRLRGEIDVSSSSVL